MKMSYFQSLFVLVMFLWGASSIYLLGLLYKVKNQRDIYKEQRDRAEAMRPIGSVEYVHPLKKRA